MTDTETLAPETASTVPGSLPNYETVNVYCAQCMGDLIGPPENLVCGTCGLPRNAIYAGGRTDLEQPSRFPEATEPVKQAEQVEQPKPVSKPKVETRKR